MSRRSKIDFKNRQQSEIEWYDLYEDWALIEASFSSQYGIRLRSEEDMSWSEFTALLSGIMPETPLGQVITIRSESDKETLKQFTPAQHKMRNDWKSRLSKSLVANTADASKQIETFQEMMKRAFS